MARGTMERRALKHVSKRRRLRNCSHSTMDLTSLADDMLTEVFLRLPDARSLLLSATVCKRWCSLILTPELSRPQRQFFEFHRLYRTDHAFSILFNFFLPDTEPYYHLWANACRPYSLSFICNSGRLSIRASSGDLLLLSDEGRRFFICNSLTKLWFPVPNIAYEDHTHSGFALVNHYNDLNHLGRYRVVVLKLTLSANAGFYYCDLTLFDSHVGTWTSGSAFISVQFTSETFASFGIDHEILNPGDGSLFWLDGSRSEYAGLVSLGAFSMELRLIPLPQGVERERKDRVNCGVVQGRVRLSRITVEGDELSLRVWELDCGDDTWSSVHHVKILKNIPMSVVGFVPNDGDSVLAVLGSEGIFRCKMGKEEYVKICEFPKEKEVGGYLKLQTLVHPFWPTALP